MAQWCELLVDLLEELDDHWLLYGDKVRLRAVCKSWYTHLPKLPNKKERKFPWLLKEIDNNEEATHALLNPIENKFYYINLPEAQGKLFKGASHGWVATVEYRRSTSPTDICLINPLTRALIKLPPRTEFPDVISYDDQENVVYGSPLGLISCEHLNLFCTDKFVMLSNLYDKNCMVVAIYSFGYLACCKINDKKWERLYFDATNWQNVCVDVILHKGKLHALNRRGEVICFESIGSGSTKSEVTVVAEALTEKNSSDWKCMQTSSGLKHFKSSSYAKYLVECSDGELIMVVRWIYLFRDKFKAGEGILCTRYFEVYKVENSRWVEVKNIGNDILFLGFNSSFSVPSSQFPSCKGNHIYFADTDLSYHTKETNQVDADMGVYNMEDGTMQTLKCFPGNFWPPAVWVNV